MEKTKGRLTLYCAQVLCFAAWYCHGLAAEPSALPSGVEQVGRIAHPALTESSGLAASRQFPGTFWTHNDGDRRALYAIRRDGTLVREFPLTGILIGDWEDIAVDQENRIYLADTGDNKERRASVTIFRIPEPDPAKEIASIPVRERWLLRYPGKPHDSEGFFVWKNTGYLVTKVKKDKKTEVYSFSLDGPSSAELQLVAKLEVGSPVTGADISADGARLVLVAGAGAFLWDIGGDVARIGKIRPLHLAFKHDSVEGCSFVDDGVLAVAESREIFLFKSNVSN